MFKVKLSGLYPFDGIYRYASPVACAKDVEAMLITGGQNVENMKSIKIKITWEDDVKGYDNIEEQQ